MLVGSHGDQRAWDIDGYLTTRLGYENASNESVLRFFADLADAGIQVWEATPH